MGSTTPLTHMCGQGVVHYCENCEEDAEGTVCLLCLMDQQFDEYDLTQSESGN